MATRGTTGPLTPISTDTVPSWESLVQSVYSPEPRGVLRSAPRPNPWAIAFRAQGHVEAPEPTIDTLIQPIPKPAAKPVATVPVGLSYSHPTRKADRIIQRAKAKVQQAERVAKYVAQGLGQVEAERLATDDHYRESVMPKKTL